MNKSVFGRIVFFLLLTLVTFFYMAAANNESLLKNDYSGTALRFGEDWVSAAQLDGVITGAIRYKTKNCYVGILVHGVLNSLG